ncbi:MAG: hypothetical protein HZC47_05890 [Methanobacterium sp.]|uniref:hypothetical protein n=1 Tax=Methanobacterium sp. TaxID=2164 RepID=UPI003D654174|nr:hypothetical protein [Methanobacterium sp.]
MGLLHAEPTEKVAEKVLKDFSDIEGLKEVVEGILSLVDSEVYEKLVHGVPNDPLMDSGDYDEPSELIKIASKNMSKFPLNIPFTPLIVAKQVLLPYTFVSDIYCIRLGRQFSKEELYNVCYGEMAARILLLLENFDSKQETPQPTKEFFKKLGKVKWQDKKAKKLFNGLHEIGYMSVFNNWKGAGGRTPIFTNTEKAFILLLSGCSAVIDGRDKISTYDIIKAHRTYFKLINTDISKLM